MILAGHGGVIPGKKQCHEFKVNLGYTVKKTTLNYTVRLCLQKIKIAQQILIVNEQKKAQGLTSYPQKWQSAQDWETDGTRCLGSRHEGGLKT